MGNFFCSSVKCPLLRYIDLPSVILIGSHFCYDGGCPVLGSTSGGDSGIVVGTNIFS